MEKKEIKELLTMLSENFMTVKACYSLFDHYEISDSILITSKQNESFLEEWGVNLFKMISIVGHFKIIKCGQCDRFSDECVVIVQFDEHSIKLMGNGYYVSDEFKKLNENWNLAELVTVEVTYWEPLKL